MDIDGKNEKIFIYVDKLVDSLVRNSFKDDKLESTHWVYLEILRLFLNLKLLKQETPFQYFNCAEEDDKVGTTSKSGELICFRNYLLTQISSWYTNNLQVNKPSNLCKATMKEIEEIWNAIEFDNEQQVKASSDEFFKYIEFYILFSIFPFYVIKGNLKFLPANFSSFIYLSYFLDFIEALYHSGGFTLMQLRTIFNVTSQTDSYREKLYALKQEIKGATSDLIEEDNTDETVIKKIETLLKQERVCESVRRSCQEYQRIYLESFFQEAFGYDYVLEKIMEQGTNVIVIRPSFSTLKEFCIDLTILKKNFHNIHVVSTFKKKYILSSTSSKKNIHTWPRYFLNAILVAMCGTYSHQDTCSIFSDINKLHAAYNNASHEVKKNESLVALVKNTKKMSKLTLRDRNQTTITT